MTTNIQPPTTFDDVTVAHLQPTIDALKAGDKVKASELLYDLVSGIKGIKSFEVAMLRDKVMKEAGIVPAMRRRNP